MVQRDEVSGALVRKVAVTVELGLISRSRVAISVDDASRRMALVRMGSMPVDSTAKGMRSSCLGKAVKLTRFWRRARSGAGESAPMGMVWTAVFPLRARRAMVSRSVGEESRVSRPSARTMIPARDSPAAAASWRSWEMAGRRRVASPVEGGLRFSVRGAEREAAKGWVREGRSAELRALRISEAWLVACVARDLPSAVGSAMEAEVSWRMIHGRVFSSLGRIHLPGLARRVRSAVMAARRRVVRVARVRVGRPAELFHEAYAATASAKMPSGMRTGSWRVGFKRGWAGIGGCG
jgi:hypothetical protein